MSSDNILRLTDKLLAEKNRDKKLALMQRLQQLLDAEKLRAGIKVAKKPGWGVYAFRA